MVILPFRGKAETEEERLAHYYKKNYTWPINKFIPDTPGWSKLMQHRLRQVEEIEDRQDRFEGFVQTLSASFIQKNYTEYGFGLARAPEDLMVALRQGIQDGLANGPELERSIDAITEPRPWFIKRPDLTKRVLTELQHYSETWVGMELTPVIAYGFRLYRNQSSLYVHVDKPETHVISFILHIDKSEDAEDWPILIEDFQGNTHEVTLTSGDILFYESSKCFHGRPRKFVGSWYTSVFVHYYPKYGYRKKFNGRDRVRAIPEHWQTTPTTHYEIPLDMHGTTLEEPTCPNGWCATEWSRKWSGPGEEGVWIDPVGRRIPFDPKPIVCEDQHEMCAEWASRKSNECETNAAYMMKNCKMSCGACGEPSRDEL